MSTLNERRLGDIGDALEQRPRRQAVPGRQVERARAGSALRLPRGRGSASNVHHVASVLYLAGGLAFRYAWVAAGHNSATDDRAVARMARHEGGEA